MRHRECPRHGPLPCTCAMGNLYRFVEPVVLFLLQRHGPSHGYELAAALGQHALTDAIVERAALYRTLKQLEVQQLVSSRWDTSGGGPARHVYAIMPLGERHLAEWDIVLTRLAEAMRSFVEEVRTMDNRKRSKGAADDDSV